MSMFVNSNYRKTTDIKIEDTDTKLMTQMMSEKASLP